MHDGPAAGVENPFERAIVSEVLSCFYDRMLPVEPQTELTTETFWRERIAVITPHRSPERSLAISLLKKALGSGVRG